MRRLGQQRSFWRRLPTHLGGEGLRASTEGGLKYLRRRFWLQEPDLCAYAADFVRPGSTVWDVGANVGLFSVMASGLAGPTGTVVAIEPDAWLVRQLRRSAARVSHRAAPIEVLPCAIASRVGAARFTIGASSLATSHLESVVGSPQAGGSRRTESVPVLTLDVLLETLPPPSVVKIDVETAELEVLRGAHRLLMVHRPVLLVEVDVAQQREVADLLVDAGYALFDGHSRAATDGCSWSTLALPVENDRRPAEWGAQSNDGAPPSPYS